MILWTGSLSVFLIGLGFLCEIVVKKEEEEIKGQLLFTKAIAQSQRLKGILYEATRKTLVGKYASDRSKRFLISTQNCTGELPHARKRRSFTRNSQLLTQAFKRVSLSDPMGSQIEQIGSLMADCLVEFGEFESFEAKDYDYFSGVLAEREKKHEKFLRKNKSKVTRAFRRAKKRKIKSNAEAIYQEIFRDTGGEWNYDSMTDEGAYARRNQKIKEKETNKRNIEEKEDVFVFSEEEMGQNQKEEEMNKVTQKTKSEEGSFQKSRDHEPNHRKSAEEVFTQVFFRDKSEKLKEEYESFYSLDILGSVSQDAHGMRESLQSHSRKDWNAKVEKKGLEEAKRRRDFGELEGHSGIDQIVESDLVQLERILFGENQPDVNITKLDLLQNLQKDFDDSAETNGNNDPKNNESTAMNEETGGSFSNIREISLGDLSVIDVFAQLKYLLRLFGVPFVIAPAEAEAQCVYLEKHHLVDGIITEDNDVFLLGAKRVFKSFFASGTKAFAFDSSFIQSDLGLSTDQLIHLGLFLGSDYTVGVKGIGVISAMEIVCAFKSFEGLLRFKKWAQDPDEFLEEEEIDENEPETEKEFKKKHRNVKKRWELPGTFPDQRVIEAYRKPLVDESLEKFEWGQPDLERLRKFAVETAGLCEDTVNEILIPLRAKRVERSLRDPKEKESQKKLGSFYFGGKQITTVSSKRLERAIKELKGEKLEEEAPMKKKESQEASAVLKSRDVIVEENKKNVKEKPKGRKMTRKQKKSVSKNKKEENENQVGHEESKQPA